ncbi:hypothetical protein AB0J38_14250 [Streptomyces sp. NPDC050095]|uniref:hypothetical protein n=1 Tax=unclassified Streptomyces TaxID=2593676 RepID=UPI00343BB669
MPVSVKVVTKPGGGEEAVIAQADFTVTGDDLDSIRRSYCLETAKVLRELATEMEHEEATAADE